MRYVVLVCLVSLLTACALHDAEYYRLHPKELQVALESCPQSAPRQVSCQELAAIAKEVNHLGYQLQLDPQGFGDSILMLQEQLARLQTDVSKNKNQAELDSKIAQDKKKIAQYLAIVRWLESPEK